MTSEPDSTPRRRPPTIDLTAQEVETEQPDLTQQNAANAAEGGPAAGDASRPGSDRSFIDRAKPYAFGGAAGAIAVGAIVAGLWFAGFAPAHETAVPQVAQAPAPNVQAARPTAADAEISSRLDKIQQAVQAPRTDEALATRITAAEAQTKALGDSLRGLSRRLDEIAASSQSAAAQAKAAAAAAEAAKGISQAAVQHGDLERLANRVAALESALKSLSADVTQHSSSADDRAARATVAADALRAAVERGAPFQAELAAVKSLGADQNALGPLAPFAVDGIPSAAALGRELAALTPALLRASGAAPPETSFLGRLEAHAQQLVHVTPIDAPAGDDASSVVARINVDAARGDIAAALADIGRLPEGARALADGWVKKAEAREAAIAASRRIAADALAALARPASQ